MQCLIKTAESNVQKQTAGFHLVPRLLAVVDLLEGDSARGEEVTELGKIDAVPEPLLQLCGGRQLLVQTGLHPSVERAPQTHVT